jgi:primosomal protein N' (replication factor Y) (superfamily II helicase)
MSDTQYDLYASVILDIGLNKTLDYGIPKELTDKVKPGMKVTVPLRGRPQVGFVHELKKTPNYIPVQPIKELSSSDKLITEEVFELALWLAKYYCAPLNKVLKAILPSSIRKDGQHKQQLFVMRNKTRDELANYCVSIRNRYPKQAEVLDAMLKVKKGILLTELQEMSGCQRGPINTLVKNEYLSIDIVRVDRSPLEGAEYFKTKPKTLNEEQAIALERIVKSLDDERFETHLLFGVTGSGKTEVYLQAIDRALQLNKGTIMLVPEISLTPQTVERFRSRFDGQIAILHHRLSQGERYDEWHKIKEGRAKIVIGARSAIFSPLPNVGLIIVDEEHESSYKQSEEGPCYNARDIAVMRGLKANAAVILGSATPSLESFYNAKAGKYTLSRLDNRANNADIPTVKIIDMKLEYTKAQGYTNFCEALLDGIKKRQELGEQSILFLNRRGYHTVLMCKSCGESVHCAHCDVSLTYHKMTSQLACHLCGFTRPRPLSCPKCKCPETMQFKGVGTEQIEKSLYAIFPDIRVIRLDADTTRHKGSHQKLLRDFGTGKADVLIGTQMVAKGLHFPQVTLVGVLNSDATLNMPDFRASETVFQLITQVSGRSGRGQLPGEVIIQTCMPENRTIQLAAEQNYEAFYSEEVVTRDYFNYPPFQRLVKICFSGTHQEQTLKFALRWSELVVGHLSKEHEVYPVVPSGYAKIKDRFRYNLLIRGPNISPINHALNKVSGLLNKPRDIKVLFDIDTLSTYF